MFNVLVNMLYNVLLTIANFVLTPLDLAFSTIFPDLTTRISQVTAFINNYITNGVIYFTHWLPVGVRGTLLFCVDVTISLYTISLTTFVIVKILSIIHKVKIVG